MSEPNGGAIRVELELARLEQIQQVMGTGLAEIVGGILETMQRAVEEIEAAIAARALEPAVQAAHACRNDALLVGASQLLTALTDLERAARQDDQESAALALRDVRAAWPDTQAALQQVVRRN